MAAFNTIKEPREAAAALLEAGVEAIIVDDELVGLKIGSLRVAPGKGVIVVSQEEKQN